MYIIILRKSYFHHEQNCVEDDEGHDEVLEGGGLDDPPELVLEAGPLLRHVPLERRRVNREVVARFLKLTKRTSH